MASCLLSEIPAACIQEILHQLDVQDWASLRQVSSTFSQHITQNIPHICLLLTDSITTEQLQEWFQATRQFHEVSSIHVHITGEVSAEVFDTAMQLMAQRSNPVTELHILAHAHDNQDASKHCLAGKLEKAHLPTLQPLQHLLPQIRTLAIGGVAVRDLPGKLKQLSAAAAATGGWQQLQSLTLNAHWSYATYAYGEHIVGLCLWSRFWHGLVDLAAAFPNLQDLSLKVPLTSCFYVDFTRNIDTVIHRDTIGSVVPASSLVGGFYSDMYDSDADPQVHAAAAAVAMVAAVFLAATQLKHLKVFNVTQVPHIWEPRRLQLIDDSFEQKLGTRTPSLLAIAAATAATTDTAVTLQTADPQVHSLTEIVRAAAAELDTLDSAGNWLLQQHPRLRAVDINCLGRAGVDWSMSRN